MLRNNAQQILKNLVRSATSAKLQNKKFKRSSATSAIAEAGLINFALPISELCHGQAKSKLTSFVTQFTDMFLNSLAPPTPLYFSFLVIFIFSHIFKKVLKTIRKMAITNKVGNAEDLFPCNYKYTMNNPQSLAMANQGIKTFHNFTVA